MWFVFSVAPLLSFRSSVTTHQHLPLSLDTCCWLLVDIRHITNNQLTLVQFIVIFLGFCSTSFVLQLIRNLSCSHPMNRSGESNNLFNSITPSQLSIPISAYYIRKRLPCTSSIWVSPIFPLISFHFSSLFSSFSCFSEHLQRVLLVYWSSSSICRDLNRFPIDLSPFPNTFRSLVLLTSGLCLFLPNHTSSHFKLSLLPFHSKFKSRARFKSPPPRKIRLNAVLISDQNEIRFVPFSCCYCAIFTLTPRFRCFQYQLSGTHRLLIFSRQSWNRFVWVNVVQLKPPVVFEFVFCFPVPAWKLCSKTIFERLFPY